MHHLLTSKTIFQHSTRVEHSSLHRNHSACMLALVIVKSLCLSGCFCVNVVLDYLGRNWRTPSLLRLNITWWSVERCGSSRWASWVVSCVRPNKEDYIHFMGELSIMLNVTFYCTVITVDPQRRYGVIVLASLMLKSSVISDLFSAVCMFEEHCMNMTCFSQLHHWMVVWGDDEDDDGTQGKHWQKHITSCFFLALSDMWLFRDFDHNVVDILSVSVLLLLYDDCYDGWCCPRWLFVWLFIIYLLFVVRVQLSLIDKCDCVKNCTKYIFSNVMFREV